jgi:hypothetical protein
MRLDPEPTRYVLVLYSTCAWKECHWYVCKWWRMERLMNIVIPLKSKFSWVQAPHDWSIMSMNECVGKGDDGSPVTRGDNLAVGGSSTSLCIPK